MACLVHAHLPSDLCQVLVEESISISISIQHPASSDHIHCVELRGFVSFPFTQPNRRKFECSTRN
jgi:hypothetical protein